jgi:hypothetical protein
MLLAGIQAEFGMAAEKTSGDDLDDQNTMSFVLSKQNHSYY